MYYYNEKFYYEVEEIVDDLDLDEMNEGDTIKVFDCNEEPIHTFSADIIAELIRDSQEERYSEDDSEAEHEAIVKILSENIDFDKINSEIPTLWYPQKTFKLYSKAELLSFLE